MIQAIQIAQIPAPIILPLGVIVPTPLIIQLLWIIAPNPTPLQIILLLIIRLLLLARVMIPLAILPILQTPLVSMEQQQIIAPVAVMALIALRLVIVDVEGSSKLTMSRMVDY